MKGELSPSRFVTRIGYKNQRVVLTIPNRISFTGKLNSVISKDLGPLHMGPVDRVGLVSEISPLPSSHRDQ